MVPNTVGRGLIDVFKLVLVLGSARTLIEEFLILSVIIIVVFRRGNMASVIPFDLFSPSYIHIIIKLK